MLTSGLPAMMEPPCAMEEPTWAAGRLTMFTEEEPAAMVSGGPTQMAMSLTRAAGTPLMITVVCAGGRRGPPVCGTGPVDAGQAWKSPRRAAGFPMSEDYGR